MLTQALDILGNSSPSFVFFMRNGPPFNQVPNPSLVFTFWNDSVAYSKYAEDLKSLWLTTRRLVDIQARTAMTFLFGINKEIVPGVIHETQTAIRLAKASGFESHLRVRRKGAWQTSSVSIKLSSEVLAMAKKESDFQSGLIKELKKRYEGCMVLKNDPNYKQGIPDLTVLYRDRWAALECKRGEKEKHQPNQDYYVGKMNEMSYSAFIFPENREQVLHELDALFNR